MSLYYNKERLFISTSTSSQHRWWRWWIDDDEMSHSNITVKHAHIRTDREADRDEEWNDYLQQICRCQLASLLHQARHLDSTSLFTAASQPRRQPAQTSMAGQLSVCGRQCNFITLNHAVRFDSTVWEKLVRAGISTWTTCWTVVVMMWFFCLTCPALDLWVNRSIG